MKNQRLLSHVFVLPFAVALVLGCKGESSPVGDAANTDLAGGEDLAAHDSPPDQGADAGLGRSDVNAQMPDASADAPADRLMAKEDLAASTPEDTVPAEAGRGDGVPDTTVPEVTAPADVPGADAKPADTADGPGQDANSADTAAGGDETGCTGWNSLVHLSPTDLADLMAKTDLIVINVHIPYEGDIPGTDTSIPYNSVDAIETYLHKDHCADVVLICKSGGMSQSAGNELVKRGYLRVRDLAGGMMAWEAAGYPLLRDGGT